MKIRNYLMALLSAGSLLGAYASTTEDITIKLLETSDVHGAYFPYDFINRQPQKGSLARISTFVNEQRKRYGDNVLLMDNGDILQGQPVAYYYNYIDTISTHVCADMLNYLNYDVANMGNHDVETGHAVYDRWISQCHFPMLGANIIDRLTGEPYLPPYRIFEREGVRIAVLGLITPAIPSWLPETMWSGLRFEDMETCARHWTKIIREQERPDVLIGLFHAGPEGNTLDNVIENGSEAVARNVPGFDVIFMGHDHRRLCKKICNAEGDSVLLIDPANAARTIADVTLKVTRQDGRIVRKTIDGRLSDVSSLPADEAFMQTFAPQYQTTLEFVSRRIGTIAESITTRDAFFGPSAFVDLIHQLQLDISGAEISFCAPLSFDAGIKAGDIYVSDMFNLYKYENLLYTMRLTGREIKGFLEMSYALWTNRMQSADDHLLLLNEKDEGFGRLKNPSFNFDSAAGILYTVDVTKPEGEKITITCMADGTPFDPDRTYTVAVNSYRGNGGGDLLTKGAGIPKAELAKRIVRATDKDLRYYLMKRIEEVQTLRPQPLNQWRFVPEEWVKPAAERDRELLFK